MAYSYWPGVGEDDFGHRFGNVVNETMSRLVNNSGHIERLNVDDLGLAHAGQQQQLVDDIGDLAPVAGNNAEIIGQLLIRKLRVVPFQKLAKSNDRRQRGFDIVGDGVGIRVQLFVAAF